MIEYIIYCVISILIIALFYIEINQTVFLLWAVHSYGAKVRWISKPTASGTPRLVPEVTYPDHIEENKA